MSFYDNIKERADILIEGIKAGFDKAKPTLDIIGRQVGLFLAEMVKEAQKRASDAVSGAEKKAAVILAATALFDTAIIGVVSIPWVPKFVATIMTKYSRPIYIAIVAGAIDALVNVLKENKVEDFTPNPTEEGVK